MLRINGYKTTTKFITHMNTSYHTATHSLPYCKFYNIFLLPVKNVSSLSLLHIHFFSNIYYIHIMISLFVAFSSIYCKKWKYSYSPSHNLHTLICQLLPDHELSIIILPLFPIPRLIVHQSLPYSNTIYSIYLCDSGV